MKKSLFLLIPVLALVFLASCSKEDTPAPPAATPQGTWIGTGQYGTGAGSPTYPFTLTFKANGTVDIVGNNSAATENATGTWAIVADSVKASYTYPSSSAIYALSGKFSSNSNVMNGTIGLSPATAGVGLFSVTRQ